MSIQKNVASQKIEFLMVDSTDFATPETGVSVTAKYNKDGGGLSTCSNTVSEVTSGLYVLTLAATETNAGVCAYQMTGTGCADQWMVHYPEDGYAAELDSILVDTKTTLDDKIDSILADTTSILVDTTSILVDTGTTLENRTTSILADTTSILVDTGTTLNGLVSDVLSTIDGPVISDLSNIESTVAVLGGDSDKITSILADTTSILVDTGTTIDDKIDSILVDTGTTLTALISDVLSTIDGPVISDLSNIESTVAVLGGDSGKITSILADTTSILVDTGTTLNGLISDVLSTIDGPVISNLSNIESIVAAQGTSGTADWSASEKAQIRSALGVSGAVSALEAYGTNSRLDNATYGLDALETTTSDILALGGGSADWTASERAQIRSALGVSGAVSALEAYGTNSRLDNATYGLNALETITSDILALGGGSADWSVSERAQIRSALGVSGAVSALEAYGTNSRLDNAVYGLNALETITSQTKSTIDGPVTSDLSSIEADITDVLVDTSSTLDNKVNSILEDTKTTLNSLIDTVESTLDGPIHSTLDAIHSTVDTIGGDSDKITSILADTTSILEDTGTTLNNLVDTVESTLDGPIHSTLDAIHSTVDTLGGDSDKITSILADTTSILVDTGVTLNSLIDSVESTLDGPINSDLTAIHSTIDGTLSADVVSISGSTNAADNLEASAETIVVGTVSHDNTAASTTVFYSDDITEATADHYNGRIVIFTSGALQNQATDITDYALDTGEGKFTVTALTEAPEDNVTFVIV